jgi:[ribosomal protein S18]-alanine N-acetyltransferase
MSPTTIAKARPEDIPELKTIEVECGLSAWSPAAYESELKRPDSIILTASVDNKMVGFMAGRLPLILNGDAEVNNLGVLPGFRRNAVGSSLLSDFKTAAVQRRAGAIWLEVRPSNRAAIALYRSHGFVERGIRPGFYRDPVEDAKLMVLDLTGLG